MSDLNRDDYNYTNITTATTTQVYSGNCRLIRIVLNETTDGAISLIDNTSGSTVNIGAIATSTAPTTLYYGIKLTTGLRIITAGASDLTVVWTKN